MSFPGKSLFEIYSPADVTLKNGKINLSGDTTYSDNPGIFVHSGGLTLEKFEITSSCNVYRGHMQHPAVKAIAGSRITAENVIFNGGFEARRGANITPFKNGSFVYSCPDAAGYYPLIAGINGVTIPDIIADGYALAEYGNEETLVPMYKYDKDGVRVERTEIWDSVTVVPHPNHIFEYGYCGCGYRCEHESGFSADGVCSICGAHAIASVGGEMFAELGTAFTKANELAKTAENVTVNIIYDLGDIYDEGYAAGKITFDLNGHDLRSSKVFAGEEDEDGNVIAEGDLTTIDSSESKSGALGSAGLLGGRLTVRDGVMNSIDINDGEANIFGGNPGNVTARGGKTNISGGEILRFTAEGGAKAEAVIESSDAKTYYETFEKAAAAVSQNDTLKLCFDADCEDGYCDYCNEKFAANVANADGAAYKYYTDINEAVKAQLEFGNSYTVKLLSDFPISIPLEFTEGSPRIDLNGHSVDNMWLKLDCRATILGDGTLNYLTISNNAGLTAATPVVNVLWIADGATWSSILPDASFGDKVYNRDMSSYKWYESGSVGEIAIRKRNGRAIGQNVPNLSGGHTAASHKGSSGTYARGCAARGRARCKDR